MAFPTSGLTNNLVHKEGNRAFVYDSALGVWDQVRETERTENKFLSGTIGSGATFPAGHVIQAIPTTFENTDKYTQSTSYVDTGHSSQITPLKAGSKIWVILTLGRVYVSSGCSMQIQIQQRENEASWGGVGASSADGHLEIREGQGVSCTAVTIVYSPSYNLGDVLHYKVQYKRSAGSSNVYYHNSTTGFPSCLTLMEITG